MQNKIRDMIVSEAHNCFHNFGFRKTTIDDITARIGISKKTVYNHFNSKEDIIKAVLEQIMDPMESQLDFIIENNTPLPHALQSMLATVHQVSACMSKPMLDDMRTQPEAWNLVKANRKIMLEKLSTILTKAKNQGLLRENLDINLFIKILINTIDTYSNPAVLLEMDITSDKFAKQVFSIFMNGIMNNREGA